MTTYQKAADALKEAVKASLDQDVEPNLQSEIWRHYQGMQNIANQLAEKSPSNFSFDSVDPVTGFAFTYDPDYNIQAAQPVELNTYGVDTITFS